MDRKFFFQLLAMVAGISALFYGRFLGNFFFLDDFKYLENVITGHLSILLGYNAQLRIVSNYSWYPIYLVWGANPVGQNLLNVFINAANALLGFLVIQKLTGNRRLAFFASMIFISSAAAADAILWKMAVSSLLSALFYLITLLFYIEYRNSNENLKYLISLAAFVLAMFSKEDAASLPLVIVVVELFYFDGKNNKRAVMKRIIPFVAIICGYLLTSYLVFHYLGLQYEAGKFFKIRPLYSLFGGFTSFFITPDGNLVHRNLLLYLAPVIIIGGYPSGDRKLSLFGSIWILLTFLPESLTSIVNFTPGDNCANSISRLLYLPSIGSALVLASALEGMRLRWSAGMARAVPIALLVIVVITGYLRVQERGEYFLQGGAVSLRFAVALKSLAPTLPAHSYVAVSNPPTSNYFTQSILRIFYGDPTIKNTYDPFGERLREGESLYIVDCEEHHIPMMVQKVR